MTPSTGPQPLYQDLELRPPDDIRVPWHPPTEPRRSGCNWGCIAALVASWVFWVCVGFIITAALGVRW